MIATLINCFIETRSTVDAAIANVVTEDAEAVLAVEFIPVANDCR
jgi:hypothetical protein